MLEVIPGSPAARAGIQPGDLITVVDGRSLATVSSSRALTADPRAARHEGRADRHAGPAAHRLHVDPQADLDARSSPPRSAATTASSSGSSSCRRSTCRASTPTWPRTSSCFCTRAPGGSCSTCATTAAASSPRRSSSSSLFLAHGVIVTHARALAAVDDDPRHRRPDRPDDPARGARQRQHRVLGRDRDRRAAGPPSRRDRRHAHLRQGRLPGHPAALQRRRDRSSRPASTTSRTAPISAPGVCGAGRGSSRTSSSPRDRAATATPAAGGAAGPRRQGPLSRGARAFPALLERRGRFVVASELFGRDAARRGPYDRRPGALALEGRRPRARDAAPDAARQPRRDRASDRPAGRRPRRDRGADARPRSRARVRRRGRGGGARFRRRPRPARAATCAALATFTIDPASARDFDDAISAERRDDGVAARVGAHRRRQRLRGSRARASTARHRPAAPASTCRARSSRCCRERSRTRNARCARRGPARRHRRDGLRRTARGAGRVHALADPLRRAARLRSRRPHLRRGGARARSRGRPRSRRRARFPRTLAEERARRGGLAVESGEPEFAFDRRGGVRSCARPRRRSPTA